MQVNGTNELGHLFAFVLKRFGIKLKLGLAYRIKKRLLFLNKHIKRIEIVKIFFQRLG